MSTAGVVSLVCVMAAATAAVFLADAVRCLMAPVAVLEILAGVLIGPRVLGLAAPTPFVSGLAQLGVCFLFFLAGHEIVLGRLRGWPARLGVAGWGISLVVAAGIALGLRRLGLEGAVLPLMLALSTTALGILVPILRDRGLLEHPLGVATLAAGVVGWVGPLVVFSVAWGGGPWFEAAARLLVFIVLTVVAAVVARRVRPHRHTRLLQSTLESSGQLAVRGSVLVLLALVLAALALHISLLLGAFSAGLLVRHVEPLEDADPLRQRLDAIGFGLLVPMFFVLTGMRLDLRVFMSARGAGLTAVFVAAFLLVRAAPALLSLSRLGPRGAAALGLFSATKLPLLVVITALAQQTGEMSATTASALVGAALVSVVAFPVAAARLAATARRTATPGAH